MTTNRTSAPEQLTLLAPSDVPVRFRLDEATRRRGLRHIAEIRARLAAGSAPAELPVRPARPDLTRRPAA